MPALHFSFHCGEFSDKDKSRFHDGVHTLKVVQFTSVQAKVRTADIFIEMDIEALTALLLLSISVI